MSNGNDDEVTKNNDIECRRIKIKNKKLVDILNHKMMKGYRSINFWKIPPLKRPKYIINKYWENQVIDPFDDNYDVEYKRNILLQYKLKNFPGALDIKNLSNEKQSKNINNKNLSPKRNSCFSVNKSHIINNSYYINPFLSKSSNFENNINNVNNENRLKSFLYKQIFSLSECGLYNDIPFIAINKIHKVENLKKFRKFVNLPDQKTRNADLEFLYKLSHEESNKRKFDHNLSYHKNINKYRYNKLHSAKPMQNRININNNKIIITGSPQKDNIFENNKTNNKKINCCVWRSEGFLSRNNTKNIKKGNVRLYRTGSAGRIRRKMELSFDIPKPRVFVNKNRVENDQILLDFINKKKICFNKLKKLMNFQ